MKILVTDKIATRGVEVLEGAERLWRHVEGILRARDVGGRA